jgi:hypothetical protein
MFNQNIGGLIMRKILITSVLTLFMGSTYAHVGGHGTYNSDLNIKMWDNSSFIITLDHDVSQRTRNFSLKNVSPGDHFVKIVKRNKNHNGYGGFVKTIYEGCINVPSKRKVFVKVEGRNRLSFKFFKKPTHHNGHGNGHHGNSHNNGHGNHNTYGSNYGAQNHNNYLNLGCDPILSQSGHQGQSNFGNNGFGNNYSSMVMNDNSFNRLMDILKNENFDSDRLGIAKQALASNHMNVNQVSAIMDQLTFDDSKLKFAKLAYNKTIDKENYFVINGKFSFSSSVSDLNNFIRHNS